MGRESFVQRHHEVFRCNFRLAEQAGKGANLYFTVHWHNTALGLTSHDHMASALPHLLNPEALERAQNLSARNVRQLRHVPAPAP